MSRREASRTAPRRRPDTSPAVVRTCARRRARARGGPARLRARGRPPASATRRRGNVRDRWTAAARDRRAGRWKWQPRRPPWSSPPRPCRRRTGAGSRPAPARRALRGTALALREPSCRHSSGDPTGSHRAAGTFPAPGPGARDPAARAARDPPPGRRTKGLRGRAPLRPFGLPLRAARRRAGSADRAAA